MILGRGGAVREGPQGVAALGPYCDSWVLCSIRGIAELSCGRGHYQCQACASWQPTKKEISRLYMYPLSFTECLTYGLVLCASMMLATRAQSQTTQHNESLPVLYGMKLDGARIAIDVASSGCTDASYFSVHLDLVSPDTYHLSIKQHKEDRCRMSVHVITVTLDMPTVPTLAGARFMLLNRLATPGTLLRSTP